MRGLKCFRAQKKAHRDLVAPLAGAWIEILTHEEAEIINDVAPLAGAWIEINPVSVSGKLPDVAPLAGAWIEMALALIVSQFL